MCVGGGGGGGNNLQDGKMPSLEGVCIQYTQPSHAYSPQMSTLNESVSKVKQSKINFPGAEIRAFINYYLTEPGLHSSATLGASQPNPPQNITTKTHRVLQGGTLI